MEFVRKVVQARAYFLTAQEGGRDRDVDLRDPRYPYELLADFGLDRTEAGHKRYCPAQLELNDGPGYIELGAEHTVILGLYCLENVVKPGANFDLSEGPKTVAKATVISVLEGMPE